MPSIFLYLLKVSGGLLVVYLFYKTALRGLTFYNANRWYLLLLSLFCFVLPLSNISAFIEPAQRNRAIVVQAIPTVEEYIGPPAAFIKEEGPKLAFSMWDAAMVLWLTGSLLLLLRLLLSYFSYRNLHKKAQPVSFKNMRLFHVDEPILPFSFGNAIYLNQQKHTEAELEEIIRHELVHVRQLHTIDVFCSELICIVNWFNPFAWLLRHAIRQNLEFIADKNVVQQGTNKTAYQYLLLNVMGGVAYPMANQFNLSPLKHRIAMLNRMPSAKRNWARFLLVLPLAGVLLLAFRGKVEIMEPATSGNKATYTGIIVDASTYKGLPGVTISDSATHAQTQTDAQGFFVLQIPLLQTPVASKISLSKEGYGSFTKSHTFKGDAAEKNMAYLMKLKRAGADGTTGLATMGVQIDGATSAASPTYEAVAAQLPITITSWKAQERFELARQKTADVYIVFEGQSYVTSGGGWASVDEVTDVVFVDGVKMTGAEVNSKLARNKIISMGAMDRSLAKKKWGIDAAVLQISTQPLEEK